MIIDLTLPQPPRLNEVGGKAFNLHKLVQIGMPVPPAIAIPASVHLNARDQVVLDELREFIGNHEMITSGASFAVRSSGIGEDGEGNSFAGIFESYLDIPSEQVFDAVQKVWQSLESTRSQMYANERASRVQAMGVVVQKMIPADYAGVAFSVCPVEKDDRIALLEVVAGVGESLVSGQKTPATIRVNKLTGITRIQRHGADELDTGILEWIAETITPLVEKIEDAYNMPVDVEWAIANGMPYILQARPITA